MATNNMDWQVGLRHVSDRAMKILDSGQWSDCIFIVGTTENSQETVHAHRLILAMASPVFEAMFYGSMADKEDKPIEILDVRPQAFKCLLKYIYADEINFTSFDQVCEICYAAKKYMIPPLVEECTRFIWKDLHPGNVCRAYAFVRLFEESQLLEKCMTMIKTLTEDVVRDHSFEEVDISTMKAILSQETLNSSELDIWEGVARWSRQECGRQSLELTPSNQRKVIQDLLPLFRFLTMSPTQFANGPALSGILTQEECYKVLMNISAPGVVSVPPSFLTCIVPRKPPAPPRPQMTQQQSLIERFLPLTAPDMDVEEPQEQLMCNCAGQLAEIFINEQLVDCSLAFSVDRDVRIVGVILPTQLRPQSCPGPGYQVEVVYRRKLEIINPSDPGRQVPSPHRGVEHRPSRPMLLNRYAELIYAFLQDGEGCRLTYTHFSARVEWDGTMEVLFNRPISIVPNMTYKIVVVLNKMGRYPLYSTIPHVLVGDVNFSFDENQPRESIVKTLIFKSASNRTAAEDDMRGYWALGQM